MTLKFKFCIVIYWFFGLIFFISGTLLFFAQTYMRQQVIKLTRLENGTEGFENWLNPKAPLVVQFYFFNVTNLYEFEKGEKAILSQVGPYVYKETKSKQIEYTERNSIGYKVRKYFYFDDSNGLSENDLVYTPNLPLLTIGKLTQKTFPKWVEEGLRFLLRKEPLLLKLSVDQVLWGYNASLFDHINKELTKWHLPSINFPQFGIFSQGGGNGTFDDLTEVDRGLQDFNSLLMITKWRNKPKLPFWEGDACNMIRGTDGASFHPFVNSSQPLWIFSTDICRSISLAYNSESVVEDIQTLHYTIPASTFNSSTPSNQCFCLPDPQHCLKSGVSDISVCKMGAPIVVSSPHFLNADEEFINSFQGLHPSPSLHTTNLHIEPTTGIVLKAEKRLQINFMIKNYTIFKSTKYIKTPLVYPLVWLEEMGCIEKDITSN